MLFLPARQQQWLWFFAVLVYEEFRTAVLKTLIGNRGCVFSTRPFCGRYCNGGGINFKNNAFRWHGEALFGHSKSLHIGPYGITGFKSNIRGRPFVLTNKGLRFYLSVATPVAHQKCVYTVAARIHTKIEFPGAVACSRHGCGGGSNRVSRIFGAGCKKQGSACKQEKGVFHKQGKFKRKCAGFSRESSERFPSFF